MNLYTSLSERPPVAAGASETVRHASMGCANVVVTRTFCSLYALIRSTSSVLRLHFSFIGKTVAFLGNGRTRSAWVNVTTVFQRTSRPVLWRKIPRGFGAGKQFAMAHRLFVVLLYHEAVRQRMS